MNDIICWVKDTDIVRREGEQIAYDLAADKDIIPPKIRGGFRMRPR